MDPTIDPDELPKVVERAKGHDADAWEELYRHCRPRLFRYARRRLDSDHEADDAVSEAFLRAIAKIDGFTWQRAGFDAWMQGITRNVVLETHRRSTRDTVISLRDGDTSVTAPQGRPANLGAELEAAEEHAQLLRALDRLSDNEREIIELRVLGGLSSDEVAVVLDKKPGAVRMAQSRALDRLRAILEELEDA